ncbi:unnamed protein product, partial [Notodromas monacha]
GMAFTLEERQKLGIHGLLPARFKTQEDQVQLCLSNVNRYDEDLNKYVYLASLQDRNERLFYRVLSENVSDLMPIVYTPTVGLVCQKFGLIYRRPRGLFITIHDRGHVYDILRNCFVDVREFILEVFLFLSNQDFLKDPFYIGLRQKRETGEAYDALIDEFMEAVFEDFGNANAFRFLDKYRDRYCTFNDDIQGTASVAVAGILGSLRVTKKKLSDNTFLFQGAGEASLGIANLLVLAMVEEGLDIEKARSKIWLVDRRGLICKGRPEGNLTGHKVHYAHDHEPMYDLEKIVEKMKPTILVGAAGVPKVFTEKILRKMGEMNDIPVIFALSNPTSKAECTAEEAYVNTDGRCVFASGSPFPNYNYKGKEFHPGQGNNAYIFPGVALGVISVGIHQITEGIFLRAAQKLASIVSDDDLSYRRVYPPLNAIRECSVKIAVDIGEYAYRHGLASMIPRPENLEKFIRAQLFEMNYVQSFPDTYNWPESVKCSRFVTMDDMIVGEVDFEEILNKSVRSIMESCERSRAQMISIAESGIRHQDELRDVYSNYVSSAEELIGRTGQGSLEVLQETINGIENDLAVAIAGAAKSYRRAAELEMYSSSVNSEVQSALVNKEWLDPEVQAIKSSGVKRTMKHASDGSKDVKHAQEKLRCILAEINDIEELLSFRITPEEDNALKISFWNLLETSASRRCFCVIRVSKPVIELLSSEPRDVPGLEQLCRNANGVVDFKFLVNLRNVMIKCLTNSV